MIALINKLRSIRDTINDLVFENAPDELSEDEVEEAKRIKSSVDDLIGQETVTVEWDSFHREGVPHIYMLWAYPEGSNPEDAAELRAISSNKDRAEKYKAVVEHENKHRRAKYKFIHIEKRRLNHFYGAGMIWAARDIEIPEDTPDEIREEIEEALGTNKEND